MSEAESESDRDLVDDEPNAPSSNDEDDEHNVVELSDDGDDDEDIGRHDAASIHARITKLLASEDYSGASHFTSQHQNPINPGIYLKGYDWLRLPLSSTEIDHF
ncbi:hypothetical protein PMZ80_001660 [Knufia obscura]|uniref:Uncharacterized protein n=2 Tax=Knufia TaxID=430999 RepID=A0AAN8ETM1_9EURO|nr:hypothetical protein PMZ80_001660 [Knufia obscura]KAK5955515.1 hypothetical protein OHC33_003155 [Knufia fluminis]